MPSALKEVTVTRVEDCNPMAISLHDFIILLTCYMLQRTLMNFHSITILGEIIPVRRARVLSKGGGGEHSPGRGRASDRRGGVLKSLGPLNGSQYTRAPAAI